MKLIYSVVLIVLLLAACGDSSTNNNNPNQSEKEANCVIVYNTVFDKNQSDCLVSFGYEIKSTEDIYSGKDIGLAPNPTCNVVFIYINIKQLGNYSIELVNLVSFSKYVLQENFIDSLGQYKIAADLSSNPAIEDGFYSVLLKKEDIAIDSVTLFYSKEIGIFSYYDSNLNCYTYIAYQNKTDSNGKIYFEPNKFNWFNKSFTRTFENGQKDSSWKISENIILSVYDSTHTKILHRRTIPFEILKEGYILNIN
ncbi:MAG TPA: hypothetical protein PK762_05235 [Candidatus Kapabacteria bacterium]|nr:hypothetical protein [Candidatus Kapabacteria bacterium]